MNYKQHQQPSIITTHSQTSSDLIELKYYHNDTIQTLIEKNEKLNQIIVLLNNRVNMTLNQLKDFELNYQIEKTQIYSELEQIASNYKLYAESHRSLKQAEKRLKDLFSNYTLITKELCNANSTTNYFRKVFNEIYSKINMPINHSNIFNMILSLKKYVNSKWEEISLESCKSKEGLALDTDTTSGRYMNQKRNKDNRMKVSSKANVKLNTCSNTPNQLLIEKAIVQKPYRKHLSTVTNSGNENDNGKDISKRTKTPDIEPVNRISDDDLIKTSDSFRTRKFIQMTPLRGCNVQTKIIHYNP